MRFWVFSTVILLTACAASKLAAPLPAAPAVAPAPEPSQPHKKPSPRDIQNDHEDLELAIRRAKQKLQQFDQVRQGGGGDTFP